MIGEIKGNMVKKEESIEINESAPTNQDRYYPEYEFVQVEHEEASLEAHVNDNKTYTEDNIERHDKNLALDKLNTSLEHTCTSLDWKKTRETQVKEKVRHTKLDPNAVKQGKSSTSIKTISLSKRNVKQMKNQPKPKV